MTRSELAQEEQQPAPPDIKTKTQKRQSEFWQIYIYVFLSSLLISLYPLFLAHLRPPTDCQRDLDQAALVLADELGKLSIKNRRFGNVGMLDFSDSSHSQMGLNRLEATLRLDGMIARQFGYDYIFELVKNDVRDACHMEHDLARLERDLARTGADSRIIGRETFTDIVRKVLSQTGSGRKLKSLKITLGGLRHSRFGSRTPLPAVPAEQASAYADGNDYRIHTEVPVLENTSYQFYEVAEEPSLITSLSQFVEIPEDTIASVVRLNAVFEVTDRGRLRQIARQTCAIVGAPPAKCSGSVFMLSFPQGYFSGISCLDDLFSPKKYKPVRGEWYQAFGGDVPGGGLLVAAPPDSPPVPPDLAAMNILYHYIFNVGPALVPTNLKMLLNEPIGTLQTNADDRSSGANSFNSGLFKDTGSARFALQRQSTGEEVKRLLSATFSSQDIEKFMPPYTFPLQVDAGGSLHLPQETGFDSERVKYFLDALYKTNIAGIEAMQVGNTIIHRMQTTTDQSLKRIQSLREELRSVKQSIESITEKQNDASREIKLSQLIEQSETLEKALNDEQTRQLLSARIKARATTVVLNGKEASRSTYEIGSHMSSFVSKGLKNITRPYRAFLLNRSLVFIPHVNSVDEDDLYEIADSQTDSAKKQADPMSWTSQQFQVTREPDSEMYVDNNPITEYWQTQPQQHTNRPLFIMMTSSELLSTKSPSLFVSRQSPFDSSAITRSQLFYFASQCLQTGIRQEVTWSVTARDLVYSMSDGCGQPLLSLNPRWCLELGMDEESCPGLGAEIQVRTPIPKLDNSISGSYLQDPDGGPSVALYPPLPVELI